MTGAGAEHFENGAMIFRQDQDFRYTSVYNPIFGLTAHGMIGRTDNDTFPPDFAADLGAIKREVVTSGETRNSRLALVFGDDTIVVDLTVSPINLDNGELIGLVGCMVNMTGLERREKQLQALSAGLAELTTRLNVALEGSMITIFEQDRELNYTFMHNPPVGTSIGDFLGKSDYELFESEKQLTLFEAKHDLIRTGEPVEFETTVEMAGEFRTYDVKLEPRKSPAGDVVGLIGVAVDMTERKSQEEHWRLVMREMTHRSKNLLAVIQAMARQTAARTDSIDVFVRNFTSRLRAMSTSHDLLVNENWRGVDLKKLVEMHVSQIVDLGAAQITIRGIDVALDSSSAQNLGLALHELMTNAVKYGSLSVPDGRLMVSWQVNPDEIRIHWIETDGPAVVLSDRSGFGRNLLETAIGASLDGHVDLQFKPDGLVCEITIPSGHTVALSDR